MDSIILGSDGGTIIKFEPTLQEPVSGPARAGQAFLYYLKGVGFRIKFFGSDGEPITEANVSVILEQQTTQPAPVAGSGQIFTQIISNVAQLFYISDEASGGVVSQLTPTPDLTPFLKKDGSVALTGNISTGTHKITSLGDGTVSGDAVNKGQLDSEATARVAADWSEATTRATADSAEAATRAAAVSAEAASRVSGDSASVTAAEAYADMAVGAEATTRAAAITSEASSRTSGDAATLAAAEAYTDANAGGSPGYWLFSPGILTLTDNDLFPVLNGQDKEIDTLLANVRTAPTGADIIVEFLLITLATMALDSSLGTVTIAAGTKTGSTVISLTNIPATKGITMQINQIGSTLPGSTLTGLAKKS